MRLIDGDCTTHYAVVQGEQIACSQIKDTDFQSKISVYEVLKVINGNPVFVKDHYLRLIRSARLTELIIDDSFQLFKDTIKKVIRLNNKNTGSIKVVYAYPKKTDKPTLICYFVSKKEIKEELYTLGVRVMSFNAVRILPNAKLVNVSFREELDHFISKNQIFEAILTKNQMITEGSRSNIFFIKENKLFSPNSKDILEGITRLKIMEIANKMGISVVYKDISCDEISSFEACFISGSSISILPVNQLNEFHFQVDNKLLRKLMKEYWNLITRS